LNKAGIKERNVSEAIRNNPIESIGSALLWTPGAGQTVKGGILAATEVTNLVNYFNKGKSIENSVKILNKYENNKDKEKQYVDAVLRINEKTPIKEREALYKKGLEYGFFNEDSEVNLGNCSPFLAILPGGGTTTKISKNFFTNNKLINILKSELPRVISDNVGAASAEVDKIVEDKVRSYTGQHDSLASEITTGIINNAGFAQRINIASKNN
jgi:hypothetical protein